IEVIGSQASQRQQQQRRPELQRHHRTHGRGAVMGEHGKHQPVLPDALHPGTDVGHQRASGPQPVVVVPERVEHAVHGGFDGSVGALPRCRRPKLHASPTRAISMPSPKTPASTADLGSKSPTRSTSHHAASRFAKPHRTLTIEDESPLPGGLANGVWKARPVTPLARWGIALARMRPPANQARWWSQNMVKDSVSCTWGKARTLTLIGKVHIGSITCFAWRRPR